MLKPRVPFIGEERKREMRAKRVTRTLKFYVEGTTTRVERNPYEYSSDDGFTHTENMYFILNVSGYVVTGRGSGIRGFFTHRLAFQRLTGRSNGDFYSKNETPFLRVEESRGILQRSSRPDLFPEAFALMHENSVKQKIYEGDEICIKALCEDRISSRGLQYIQLSRVQEAGLTN